MKLYEISNELKNCIKVDEDTYLNEETGEVIDTEAIEKLHMDFETKAIHIARWIKELKAEAEAIKNEKDKLQRRQKAAENKAESLKNYLQSVLDGKPISDATVKISYRKSEVVNINEDEFMKFDGRNEFLKPVEPDIAKAEIKKALKNGREIPGCSLENKTNMQIG